jgi:hypothetical protein
MGWRGLGFVHHSRTIFCRAVPNPNITIRNFFIAVGAYKPTADSCAQKLTGLISLYTNPVSILNVPYSNRPLKALNPLIRLMLGLLTGKRISKSAY